MCIFKDKDDIYKHREVGSSSSFFPMPESGPTNQMLDDKLFHMENFMTQELRDICLEIANLKNNQNQEEIEEESEDESD